ncbi:hypothetical protein B0H13DRAFT_1896438 [Mycena leptocephala]|nr:hypothetical protein B0H13DRAFT_1896438 [Mycena leptocephala]
MSYNPAHFNTAAALAGFEKYAHQLRAAGAGNAPFPGDPPHGYRDFYLKREKFAPLPEDYPHLLAPKSHEAAGRQLDAALSTGALGTILDSQHRILETVLAEHRAYQPNPRPVAYPRVHGRAFRGCGGYRGMNRGAPNLADRIGGFIRGKRAGYPSFAKGKKSKKTTVTVDKASDIDAASTSAVYDEPLHPDDIPEQDELEEGQYEYIPEEDNGFNADASVESRM